MRSLLLLLLVSASTFAQIHQNEPIPEIDEKSVKIIDEDIIGWSKSFDGQWLSKEMTIPIRAISQDEIAYESDESELGQDNISELHLYKTKYGEEQLYTLIKIFRTGSYKYTATQQKWQETLSAYYYIFEADQMKKLLEATESNGLIRIPLRDYGLMEGIKSKKIIETLTTNLVIKNSTDRLLVAVLKLDGEHADKIYFQISSQHEIFPDVEGILNDFTLQGNTVYNSPLLLDYLHYEYDKEAFKKFFTAE
ncbi:hypothetical protein [Owenweeksia hongkongensis]|uniref:hypothetical protein n=1 Tax=Owenweeksia hongkongensis TaxID=253245 RepID=UPI003A9205A2